VSVLILGLTEEAVEMRGHSGIRRGNAQFARRVFATLFVAFGLVVLGACSSSNTPGRALPTTTSILPPGAVDWALRPQPMALVQRAGLTPTTREFFDYHVHAHLDVFLNGHHVAIPGGIGIDITDPAVHRSMTAGRPGYGGIRMPSGVHLSFAHSLRRWCDPYRSPYAHRSIVHARPILHRLGYTA
jgi:hypothetical protein